MEQVNIKKKKHFEETTASKVNYGVLNTDVWKVTVIGEDIIFRNSFGITRKYQFADITCAVEKRSGALRIYSGNKKIFTFDDNVAYNYPKKVFQ